jgi:ABC-type Fe3+ transport system permease subunit
MKISIIFLTPPCASQRAVLLSSLELGGLLAGGAVQSQGRWHADRSKDYLAGARAWWIPSKQRRVQREDVLMAIKRTIVIGLSAASLVLASGLAFAAGQFDRQIRRRLFRHDQ